MSQVVSPVLVEESKNCEDPEEQIIPWFFCRTFKCIVFFADFSLIIREVERAALNTQPPQSGQCGFLSSATRKLWGFRQVATPVSMDAASVIVLTLYGSREASGR